MGQVAGGSAVEVGGRTLRVTNLNKVLYPATGVTKGEVIAYFQSVAPSMVPVVMNRPATRKRWPHGVGTATEPTKPFFHKGLDPQSTPAWVATGSLDHDGGPKQYPLVNDAATLVWLAQLASLEIHVPQWRFDHEGIPLNPDRMVLDLDPGPGSSMGQCVELAHLVREVLDGVGMDCVPVTSGSKGIHIYAPLDGAMTSSDASEFAHQLARSLEALRPDLVVSDMKKELRQGRILLDWSQNNASKTTIAPYSLRGRELPTVAAPRTWEELTPQVQQLTFTDVVLRLAEGIDPFSDLFGIADRLTRYRSMRDAALTPEPVPATPVSRVRPTGGEGRTFVIQRHQASRLHHDFRLEHEGVLVSWALPKGPPTDPGRNHLAVKTEDHPLEYATFEGDIPASQYGGGHVDIWDTGTFELEKWRDGKEVIATLTGGPEGGLGGVPRRFALINTSMGGNRKNWLIHLMEPGSTREDAAAPESSGRAPVPTSPAPMLATAGRLEDVATGEWSHEIKWDGYRAIASFVGGRLTLTSRGGRNMTSTYPELGELASALAGHEAILDGEIVVLDDKGVSRFGLLQGHGAGTEAHYMAFDLLNLDGESLLHLAHAERRERLQKLVRQGRLIHVPDALGTDVAEALATSRELGLEGIVSKESSSPYEAGRRSPAWIKIKHVRFQKAVVIGFTAGRGARSTTLGSVLLAVNDETGGLRYAGKAGSGFTDEGLTQAREILEDMRVADVAAVDVPENEIRNAQWVEPLLVGEVSFIEWTTSGRMRQPIWRGWRPDTRPESVHRVE